MNRLNKFSIRSGWIDTNEDRPKWQKDRGARYGNNRKYMAKLKWKQRKKQRRINNEN